MDYHYRPDWEVCTFPKVRYLGNHGRGIQNRITWYEYLVLVQEDILLCTVVLYCTDIKVYAHT